MRPWYGFVHRLAAALLRFLLAREVRGLERIPKSGGVILAANHGSFWDPPVLGGTVPREITFLAKAELFEAPLFGALIRSLNSIPIRRGVADLAGIGRAVDGLSKGAALLVFPEGGRMKDGRLHPARPGLGLLEAHARVPIVPIYISGTSHIRRCLLRLERVRVTVGEPLPETLWFPAGTDPPQTGRALHQAIGDRVMHEIALLRQQEEAARGVPTAPGPTFEGAASHERGGSS